MWFGSMDLISAAVSHSQSANAVFTPSFAEKHLGSLAICHEKMDGSSLYGMPVTVFIRETTVRTWAAKSSFALSFVTNCEAYSIYAGHPATDGSTASPAPAHSRYLA